ncbi:uncharacterized protein BDW43DRAFT_318700 [Aspergillus alliaceus]|uniref:uncharacterized protein n=1 Tax=Petromyces alliaceus TaxID=209559 RepID=UPI0012A3BFB4|nr:uncharacterized protein BDW43DRAFT_318700 [Aspergillus alliaceus]KAB8234743.1 hypothetical protein BDW43DRAFT_318700 [Aspergillus alliaceus]
MDSLDDKDIEAARVLIALAETARREGSRRAQPSVDPRRRSRQGDPMDIDTPHLEQNQALQAYLFRQQLIAGIAPENMISMRSPRPGHPQDSVVNKPNDPSVMQITHDGIVIPNIPPARFTGVLHPLPTQAAQAAQAVQGHRAAVPLQRRSTCRRAGVGLIKQSASGIRTQVVQSRNPVSHEGSSASGAHQFRHHVSENPHQQISRGGIRSRGARCSGQQNNHLALSDQQDRPQRRIQLFPTLSRGSISAMSLPRNDVPPENDTKASKSIDLPHNGFDILLAFTYHQAVALDFTEYLEVEDLILLFTISKPFNQFVKKYCSEIVIRQATQKAPESAQIFPFRCYPSLCIDYTNVRQQSIPTQDIGSESNLAPSFRWLQMILYREAAVQHIMAKMLQAGHGLPKRCEPAIKKIWFLMDIPDNKRRNWTVDNCNLWENIDIFFAVLFIAQLDTALKQKRTTIKGRLFRLLMAQPTLTLLWDVMKDIALRNEFEILKAFVRWKYTPLPHETELYVYGVPPQDVGALQYEGYGRDERSIKLMRPDELILREMNRRHLDLSEMYKDIFMWGNVAPYYSRSTQAVALWDEEMKREAEFQGMDWQEAVSLDRLGLDQEVNDVHSRPMP